MFACLDVHYRDSKAHAAVVCFDGWDACEPKEKHVRIVDKPAEYEPGQFYKRELPSLLTALRAVHCKPSVVIIDGYVWLDKDGRPGLGAHLYEATSHRMAVIGVAKTPFKSAPAVELLRGKSAKPLFITSAGMPVNGAAECIAAMHGTTRIPTIMKIVDQLSRGIYK